MKLKRCFAAAALFALCLLSGCHKDGVWGVYRTEGDPSGNYKSVEFAYSKTFYTADAFAAAQRDSDGENDALLEGWYTESNGEVRCVYTIEDGNQTQKVEYLFRYDKTADTLTLNDTGEIYTKEEAGR